MGKGVFVAREAAWGGCCPWHLSFERWEADLLDDWAVE